MPSQSLHESNIFTLNCFYKHLPDRHQELFFQPLASFPLRKLPVELRLMIWRAMIPRERKIWLHPQKAKNAETPASKPLPILPATQVCIESRQELSRYLRVRPHSRTPICITRLDIIRCDFNLLLRVDARHEEFLHLLGRRGQLVSQVRELEIKVDSFDHLDELYLILSGDIILEPFVRLERLRLLVPAGADWMVKCEDQFTKICRGYWRMASTNGMPLLRIEEY